MCIIIQDRIVAWMLLVDPTVRAIENGPAAPDQGKHEPELASRTVLKVHT
jgi:hypothetical protein